MEVERKRLIWVTNDPQTLSSPGFAAQPDDTIATRKSDRFGSA
jgi:hypothetical protein